MGAGGLALLGRDVNVQRLQQDRIDIDLRLHLWEWPKAVKVEADLCHSNMVVVREEPIDASTRLLPFEKYGHVAGPSAYFRAI